MGFIKKILGSKKETPEKMIKKLLRKAPPPKQLSNILTREYVSKIRKTNEFPSLGHTLDEIKDDLKKNMRPLLKFCYSKGYLHLIPLVFGNAGQISELSIHRIENGEVKRELYSYPGEFLFVELIFDEEMDAIKKNVDRNEITEEQLLKDFSIAEPGLSTFNKVPEIFIQIRYEKYNVYRIYKYENVKEVDDVINLTIDYFRDVTEDIYDSLPSVLSYEIKGLISKGNFDQTNPEQMSVSGFRGYKKGFLILDIPGNLQSEYRVWWKHNDLLFSAHDIEKTQGEREDDRIFGKFGFVSCFLDNLLKLKLNPFEYSLFERVDGAEIMFYEDKYNKIRKVYIPFLEMDIRKYENDIDNNLYNLLISSLRNLYGSYDDGQFDNAKKHLDSLENYYDILDEEMQIKYFKQMCIYLYKTGHYDEAIEYYYKALSMNSISKDIPNKNDLKFLIKGILLLDTRYQGNLRIENKENIKDVIYNYEKFLSLLNKVNNPLINILKEKTINKPYIFNRHYCMDIFERSIHYLNDLSSFYFKLAELYGWNARARGYYQKTLELDELSRKNKGNYHKETEKYIKSQIEYINESIVERRLSKIKYLNIIFNNMHNDEYLNNLKLQQIMNLGTNGLNNLIDHYEKENLIIVKRNETGDSEIMGSDRNLFKFAGVKLTQKGLDFLKEENSHHKAHSQLNT